MLKLTCTADDMRPLAEAAGFDPPVHKWNPGERAELMAELDAAFFLLYGIDRDDAEYILSTFARPAGGRSAVARVPLDGGADSGSLRPAQWMNKGMNKISGCGTVS